MTQSWNSCFSFSFSFFVLRYCLRNFCFFFFSFLCYCIIIIIVPLHFLNRILLLFGILFVFVSLLCLLLLHSFQFLLLLFFISSATFSFPSFDTCIVLLCLYTQTHTPQKKGKKSANIYPCAEKHTTEIRANLRISTRLTNEATKTKRGGEEKKNSRILPRGLQKLLRGRTSLDPVAVTWEKRHSARGTLA